MPEVIKQENRQQPSMACALFPPREGLRREGGALPAFNTPVPASGRFAPSEPIHFVGSGTAERYTKAE